MTEKARIYQPAKTAMQSGRAKTKSWLLEFEPTQKNIDPLMGWTGSNATLRQLRIYFSSQDAAVAYAQSHNIPYMLDEPHSRSRKRKSYADNFSFHKVETYTPPPAKKPA